MGSRCGLRVPGSEEDSEHLCTRSFAVHASVLVTRLVTHFAHFVGLFVFLFLTCESSLCIPDINYLLDIRFASIFS